MPSKKRPSAQAGKPQTKRLRRFQNDQFRSQDIWKNLDRVRNSNDNAEAALKNSYLFIPLLTKSAISEYVACVQALHEYIDAKKLQLQRIRSDYGFIVLKGFSLLDCCLVLTVVLALKNKKWIAANTRDHFNIPSNVALSGSFYLPGGSILSKFFKSQHPVNILTPRYRDATDFEEIFVDAPTGVNLTPFMDSLSLLFAQTKFGNSVDAVNRFRRQFKIQQESLTSTLSEPPGVKKLFLDMAMVTKDNLPLLQGSKVKLEKYAQDLMLYNNKVVASENSSSRESTHPAHAANSVDAADAVKRVPIRQQNTIPERTPTPTDRSSDYRNANTASGTNAGKYSGNGSFMTQEQIKDHCIATVKASMDVMKTKSPYQIFRLYVKCPRQHYIDVIYQNLNDLRAQTNCNIVVLNLSNLYESDPWFESLDVSPYTKSFQRPHPSTVRVISVGGIGEHITKALEAIYEVLNT